MFFQRHPQKEESFITQTLDKDGVLFSGGETQKLLLAKAIYKNGPVLILDEPTSALDPIAESRIYEEYNQMADNKIAVFIFRHRLAIFLLSYRLFEGFKFILLTLLRKIDFKRHYARNHEHGNQ